MYGIYTYIYHKNQLNVGKYASPMDGMGTRKVGVCSFTCKKHALIFLEIQGKSSSFPLGVGFNPLNLK